MRDEAGSPTRRQRLDLVGGQSIERLHPRVPFPVRFIYWQFSDAHAMRKVSCMIDASVPSTGGSSRPGVHVKRDLRNSHMVHESSLSCVGGIYENCCDGTGTHTSTSAYHGLLTTTLILAPLPRATTHGRLDQNQVGGEVGASLSLAVCFGLR
jgi:hypothetical protein